MKRAAGVAVARGNLKIAIAVFQISAVLQSTFRDRQIGYVGLE